MPKIIKICERCGKEFHTYSPYSLKYPGKYCNKICHGIARRRPMSERFWEKVKKLDGDDACWIWTAGKLHEGYGVFLVSTKNHQHAHRVSYEMEYGDFDKSLYVLHRCDNPPCVRPSHLFLGTLLDNSRDMVEKGRSLRGKRHFRSKVTEEQVREIRLAKESGESDVSIALRFGMRKGNVWNIIKRKSWAYLI